MGKHITRLYRGGRVVGMVIGAVGILALVLDLLAAYSQVLVAGLIIAATVAAFTYIIGWVTEPL